MNTIRQSGSPSDLRRAQAVLKAERRVTASLLQRRLGIGYIAASQLATELEPAQAGLPVRYVDLLLNSRTLRLLMAISAGPLNEGEIGIAEDEFHALLTGQVASTTVAVRSAVGHAVGTERAALAIREALRPCDEFAPAIRGAHNLVVLVGAASATLMGRELKIISRELRIHVGESCSISLGVQCLEPSDDDPLFVAVIFSL